MSPRVSPSGRNPCGGNNSVNRYGNPNATRGYFGRKSHSHPRLVKQRQLKSQWRRKRKAEIVSVPVLIMLNRSIVFFTNLEYRAGERQRKRESTRQASTAQQEKGQQRSKARETKTKDIFFWEGGTTWKFCSGGYKMRNVSGHPMQGENERQWHFRPETCN